MWLGSRKDHYILDRKMRQKGVAEGRKKNHEKNDLALIAVSKKKIYKRRKKQHDYISGNEPILIIEYW